MRAWELAQALHEKFFIEKRKKMSKYVIKIIVDSENKLEDIEELADFLDQEAIDEGQMIGMIPGSITCLAPVLEK